MRPLRVALLNPFHTGSHRQWAQGIEKYSSHTIVLTSLPGRHWKWRMHSAGLVLAQRIKEQTKPDVIITTDMLDSSQMRAALPSDWRDIPLVVYMHENQITYPWSETDEDPQKGRDKHYGFANFSSACTTDALWFNSQYHKDAFLKALPHFLGAFPDGDFEKHVSNINRKSRVVELGFEPFDVSEQDLPMSNIPRVLWNHRWEYDKNPETFFKALQAVKQKGGVFQLIVLGESYDKSPSIFDEAKKWFEEEIVEWGFVESREKYRRLVQSADIIPVTSNQDFFGLSAIEAVHAGVSPIVPNRLAFPEWIGNRDAIYRSYDELVTKLEEQIKFSNKRLNLSKEVHRFSWPHQIKHYDDAIRSACAQIDLKST